MEPEKINRNLSFKIRLLWIIIIDMFLLYFFFGVFFLFNVALIKMALPVENYEYMAFAMVVSLILGWYGYFFIAFRKTGKTIAMKLFNVKVISSNGGRLTVPEVFIWAIFIPTPMLIFLSYMLVFSESGITMAERISKTMYHSFK